MDYIQDTKDFPAHLEYSHLDFNLMSMTKLLDKINNATQESDYYWKQVRHIPESLDGWDTNDELNGDEEFGLPKVYGQAWGIQFD